MSEGPGQLQESEEVGVCWGQGWQVQGSGAVVVVAGPSAWRVVRPPGRTGVLDSSTVLPLEATAAQIPFPFSFWALVTFGAKLTNIGLENITIFLPSSSHILDSQILI